MQEQAKRKHGASSTKKILKQCAAIMVTFYAGFTFGYHQGSNQTSRYLRSTAYDDEEPQATPESLSLPPNGDRKLYTEQEMNDAVQRKVELFTKLHNRGERRAEQARTNRLNSSRKRRQLNRDGEESAVPLGAKGFAAAMSYVDRNQFAEMFDTGVPLVPSNRANAKVLLLHGKKAVPNSTVSDISIIDKLEEAVENCNYVSLVLTHPSREDQCIAIMGQYNSYHVHKFMRVANNKPTKVVVDPSQPLKLVKRGTNTKQTFGTKTPSLAQTQRYWNSTLREYFGNLDSYLKELDPILREIALCKTVIVMTCNLGQSELLMNFVCNARAKNLDTSAIVVFATDAETAEIAKGLGLATFYNEEVSEG